MIKKTDLIAPVIAIIAALIIGQFASFSDGEILAKVPRVFPMLGSVFLLGMGIGMFWMLIFDK